MIHNKKLGGNGKQPFSKRHPRVSILFSFLFLFFLIGLGVVLLFFLKIGIEHFLKWLSSLSSNVDAVVVVALITGILSLLTVIVSKRIEFKKNREDYLSKKREGPYGAFVDMVYKIMDNGKTPGSYSTEDMKSDFISFSKEITLWGSPKVVKKWREFRENGTNPKKAFDNLFLIEDLMNEMRKDLGMKKTNKGGLLSFFVNDLKGHHIR